MEFWGVEVPPKKPLKCDPGSDSYFHVSQAALGETKDKAGNERVVLKVRVGDNEYVVGTLSQGKCDQTPLDLIFDKEFSLSHNSTSSTVYFCGYKTEAVKDQFDVSDDEEDVPDNVAFPMKANGKVNPKSVNTEKDKASKEKSAITTEKPAAKTIPATKEKPDLVEIKSAPSKAKPGAKMATEDEEDEEDDDDDIDDEDEDEDDEDEDEGEDDESDEDDDEGEDDELDFLDSDDEDESEGGESEEDDLKSAPASKRLMAKPKEGTPSKKMKLGTPFQGKGAKSEGKPSTPASTTKQQTPGKNAKSGAFAKKSAAQENASPPLQAAKGAKSNTPGSGKKFGQFLCNTCNRNFATETGLSQHQTAKHSK